MSERHDPYVWPGSTVLRNHFGITDAHELERTEREVVNQRISEGCPSGSFDQRHLQAIHHHLFEEMYDWAGDIRTLNISKGGSHFIPHQFIQSGLADVHKRIVGANYLRNLTPEAFAITAGEIIGDVNYVHPFREGNGRTQLEYLRQLGERAGQTIDLAAIDPTRWIEASKRAQSRDFGPMAAEIRTVLRDREPHHDQVAAWEQFGAQDRTRTGTIPAHDEQHARDRRDERER